MFGFEEALGYSAGGIVRDKDGISAALLFADLVADLAEDDETALDRLLQLWQRHGVWASAQISIAGEPEGLVAAVERLGSTPPEVVDGREVAGTKDFRKGAETRPPWLGRQNLIELSLGESGRVLVRPSGTEPKLKIYVDLGGAPGADLVTQQRALVAEAEDLGRALAAELGL